MKLMKEWKTFLQKGYYLPTLNHGGILATELSLLQGKNLWSAERTYLK